MAVVQHTHGTSIHGRPAVSSNGVGPDYVVVDHRQNVAGRIVWLVAGILIGLLSIRFVLALLGANPFNTFASFIYSVTHPFVAPFFGLFSYNYQIGASRFEAYTLVAMAVYALVAYALEHLVTINRYHDPAA